MRSMLTVAAALFSLSAVAAEPPAPPAAATASAVSVRFTKAETFTDASYDNRRASRKDVMRDLSKAFAERARRWLPAGQRLDIEVTDIDLAGRYEPWHGDNPDIRYLREATWPRLSFNYRVLDGEREIAQGKEQLSDMNYLVGPRNSSSGDRLYYEKRILDGWFQKRFAAPSPAR